MNRYSFLSHVIQSGRLGPNNYEFVHNLSVISQFTAICTDLDMRIYIHIFKGRSQICPFERLIYLLHWFDVLGIIIIILADSAQRRRGLANPTCSEIDPLAGGDSLTLPARRLIPWKYGESRIYSWFDVLIAQSWRISSMFQIQIQVLLAEDNIGFFFYFLFFWVDMLWENDVETKINSN